MSEHLEQTQILDELLAKSNYAEVTKLYQQHIEAEPDHYSHYLHLGLLYLLQEQETEAESTWFYLFAQVDENESKILTSQLTKLLDFAAKYYSQSGDFVKSQLLRNHLREIDPTNINNLLESILAAENDCLVVKILIEEFRLIELLTAQNYQVCSELLLQVVLKTILLRTLGLVTLAQACIPYANPASRWVDTLLQGGDELMIYGCYEEAIILSEICLKLQPNELHVWFAYARFHSLHPDYQRRISTSLVFKQKCLTPYWLIRGCFQLINEFAKAGHVTEVSKLVPEFKAALLAQLNEDTAIKQDADGQYTLSIWVVPPGILQYFQDNPQENRYLQNQTAIKFQAGADQVSGYQSTHQKFRPSLPSKRLKIGYIGHTLRTHSVGWLCRWLFKHHDHEKFHISTYCIGQSTEELFTKIWFIDPSDASFALPDNLNIVAHKIFEDEIDILVDLDSMTYQSTCSIMAARSAPVQATWLGFDACGLPAIDYFIADPFVLPENAQDYYQEKIWRLPETYIAVDGFEVGVPDISRAGLGIPENAVIYYSSQVGSKRNSANIRLQLQILKSVPNSFLLIKGVSQKVIQQIYTDLAEEVGISPQQIRFLEEAPSEFVHRANLQIADVILDTYPYTGATTTLEALWMGIPVVTRVGEQFASRNSYAFMTNAGIKEGIAYADQEYIEWGIRYGQERDLRHQVMWKLQQSRQTSPLWDAKAFTRQMEAAYQQMWEIYCQS
jgi:predicted O-linked N-acetylglucosamine transferase (SPINDLY family)